MADAVAEVAGWTSTGTTESSRNRYRGADQNPSPTIESQLAKASVAMDAPTTVGRSWSEVAKAVGVGTGSRISEKASAAEVAIDKKDELRAASEKMRLMNRGISRDHGL